MGIEKQGITIRQRFFKNPRVILAQPTPLTFPGGKVGPELLMYYKRLSILETSVIFAGPAGVTAPFNRKFSLLRADQPKYFDGIKALVKILTGNGAIAGIQLTIPPPIGNPLDWYRSDSNAVTDFEMYPPLQKGLSSFYKACKRCGETGFGWVELDFSARSFLNQAWKNSDEKKQMTFFKTCRKMLGENTVFGMRISRNTHQLKSLSALFFQNQGDIIAFDDATLQISIPTDKSLVDHPGPNSDLKHKEGLFLGLKPEQVFQA